jgi:hypothetical protein
MILGRGGGNPVPRFNYENEDETLFYSMNFAWRTKPENVV